MTDARATATCVLTGLAWGLSPWVPDAGLLVFAAAVGWAALVTEHPGRAGWAGVIGASLHLAWLPGAWTYGGDGSPWPVFVALSLGLGGLPGLAVWIAGRCDGPRAVLLGLAFTAVAGLREALPVPVLLHATLLAEDTHVWLWPGAIGGAAVLTGLVAAWGGLALDRPRVALGTLGVWGALGLLLPALPTSGTPLTVGVVQPDVDPLTGRTPSRADDVRARLVALLDRVADADVVVTPEGAWPHDPGDTDGSRRQGFLAAHARRPPALIGATVGSERPRTNSVLAVEQGRLTGRVDKRLLVPVWERGVLGFGADRYRPGHTPTIVSVAGARVGALICVEDLFPGPVRRAAAADWIVAPTNDGWNGPGAGSRAHLGAARLVAVTTGRWVVRPALTGPSAVFDRWGRTVWSTPFERRPFDASTGRSARVPILAGGPRAPGAWLEPWAVGLAALVLLLRARR